MRSLDDHAFEQRKATLIAKLDDLGDVTGEDSGARTGMRRLELVASAPGAELDPLAEFEYTELFRRTPTGRWAPVRYAYEYRERPAPGRRAYHWHDDRFHAHCLDRERPDRDHHFRATEVDIFEAHEEFVRLHASSDKVTCEDLRPALREGAESQ